MPRYWSGRTEGSCISDRRITTYPECNTVQGCYEDTRVQQLGCLDSGTGKHQSNQVISYDGLMTCEYAGQHKNPQRFIDIKEVDNE